MHMYKLIKSKKGFSYIEMIIVCTIIGILSIFAFAAFTQMRESAEKALSGLGLR